MALVSVRYQSNNGTAEVVDDSMSMPVWEDWPWEAQGFRRGLDTGYRETRQQTLLPILPSIAYTLFMTANT